MTRLDSCSRRTWLGGTSASRRGRPIAAQLIESGASGGRPRGADPYGRKARGRQLPQHRSCPPRERAGPGGLAGRARRQDYPQGGRWRELRPIDGPRSFLAPGRTMRQNRQPQRNRRRLPARRQPPVDRFGHPLPDRLVAVFHGEVAREMLSLQRELLQLARRAKRLAESSDPAAACLHRQVLPKAVMRAAKIISRTMPWIVCRPCEGAGTCPSCGGKGCDRCRGGERGACAVCRGRGWLSASEYSRLREPARWPDAPPTATPTHVPKIADLREAARAQGDDVHVRNSAAQERSNPSDRPGINSWPDLRPERIDPPSYAGDV